MSMNRLGCMATALVASMAVTGCVHGVPELAELRRDRSALCASAESMVSGSAGVGLEVVSGQGVWLLGDGKASSVEASVGEVPSGWRRVQVEVACVQGAATEGEFVCRVELSQPERKALRSAPLRCAPAAGVSVLAFEGDLPVEAERPLTARVTRDAGDALDTSAGHLGVALVRVTQVEELYEAHVVQDCPGYNSWPMLQAIGNGLVCAYARGTGHDIGQSVRGVYARCSDDGGKTWMPEVLVSNQSDCGEVTIGKGLDENGDMLLWVRCCGRDWRHDLYRTRDGLTFEKIATVRPKPMPMQITDVFHVPTVGLMSLWFASNYKDDATNAWGTLVSRDNGKTWEQRVIEQGIPKAELPTEQSVAYIGNGRIFGMARTEYAGDRAANGQFQLESLDYGVTWTRRRTNITDVLSSTPSVVYDAERGVIVAYYFQRGRGILKRRVARLEDVAANPLAWPAPEFLVQGSTSTWDTGNVNVTVIGQSHYATYYTGKHPDTMVVVAPIAYR